MSVIILSCPSCTLQVVECACHASQCGGYVHTLNQEHSCNPGNPECPYYAQSPRRVTK